MKNCLVAIALSVSILANHAARAQLPVLGPLDPTIRFGLDRRTLGSIDSFPDRPQKRFSRCFARACQLSTEACTNILIM
jgi:hypothetical protein